MDDAAMTPEEEHEFCSRPENQVPQGPARRRLAADHRPGAGAVPAGRVVTETLRIRLAARGDTAEVAACMAAFRDLRGRDEPSDEALIRGVRHVLARGLAEFLLVGRPAHSYVQLRYIYSAWLQSDVCWVEDVYVGDGYRGLGVGRALMRAAESRACELNCSQLQLDANERNEIAVALYESEGYSATSAGWDGGRYLFFRRKVSISGARGNQDEGVAEPESRAR